MTPKRSTPKRIGLQTGSRVFLFCAVLLSLLLTTQVLCAQELSSDEADTPDNLLTHEFSIFYQNSAQLLKQGKTQVSGWREHQLQASGQMLIHPQWLLKANIMGDRADLELEGFSINPAFSSDSFLGELSLNYLWSKSPNWELASGFAYLYSSYTPDNVDQFSEPIPYTNSVLDFEYRTQGPGLYSLSTVQLSERLSLMGNASLYPFLFTAVKKGPDIHYSMLGRGNLQLRYQVMKGFLLSAFFNQELWMGDFFNANSTFGIGLTLVPDQISQE